MIPTPQTEGTLTRDSRGFGGRRERRDRLPHILLFAATGATGQIFIFNTIREFGALVCSTATTVRKFLNVRETPFSFRCPPSIGFSPTVLDPRLTGVHVTKTSPSLSC